MQKQKQLLELDYSGMTEVALSCGGIKVIG